MGEARKAPPGSTWRPSTISYLRRVLVLERDNGEHVGSVGPEPRGRWSNRDTGEQFATRDEAQQSVEKYLR